MDAQFIHRACGPWWQLSNEIKTELKLRSGSAKDFSLQLFVSVTLYSAILLAQNPIDFILLDRRLYRTTSSRSKRTTARLKQKQEIAMLADRINRSRFWFSQQVLSIQVQIQAPFWIIVNRKLFVNFVVKTTDDFFFYFKTFCAFRRLNTNQLEKIKCQILTMDTCDNSKLTIPAVV